MIFLGATMLVVYKGVDKGIERFSRILMPVLLVLILGVSVFSLTLRHTDDAGLHGRAWRACSSMWCRILPA